ncbi:DUF421 domain-containing protein [Luteimonas sp. SJ-92]|uniref:DUF421 domain-containing protein n=1 Tax=Luteimonas salinisoli TaxID=2752307 RepID=A0A853JAL9_9GAMM|nr:YetF domain-containing protein [Luteimonas salinisoli]NZA25709.1 DUF421 domain-containing protein [Luteimonas salinisoli]
MFFESWSDLGRVLAVGVCAYAALILLLRASGKRTLTKMNAFDFVVTIALGSTLATILLNRDVSLAEGVLAMALLVWLQFAITWSSARWAAVHRLVASEPTLLLHDGEFLREAMRRERVNERELRQGLRNHGIEDPGQARCVVLETDGAFSVVRADSR